MRTVSRTKRCVALSPLACILIIFAALRLVTTHGTCSLSRLQKTRGGPGWPPGTAKSFVSVVTMNGFPWGPRADVLPATVTEKGLG